MQYVPGETVVHPVHGPLQVQGTTSRTVRDQPVLYVDLLEPVRHLHISIPVDRADDIGLRAVMSAAVVDDVLAELAADSEHSDQGWSRRMKDYELRLQTRHIRQHAIVARELLRRSGPRPSSTQERFMLRDTLSSLAREFELACGWTEEEARTRIEDAALQHVVPPPAAEPAR